MTPNPRVEAAEAYVHKDGTNSINTKPLALVVTEKEITFLAMATLSLTIPGGLSNIRAGLINAAKAFKETEW